MNKSDLTRQEQVLKRLLDADEGWVDGPDLASAEVGGSEGLKRLRELRDAGHDIRKRKHPDPDRDIYQYRLVRPEHAVFTIDPSVEVVESERVEVLVAEPAEKYDYKPEPKGRRSFGLARTESGAYVVNYDPDHEDPVPEGQIDMGVEETPGAAFTTMPDYRDFSRVRPCPRCKGVRRKIRERDPVTNKQMKNGKVIAVEDYCRDPHKPSQACIRCNGFGLVPPA